MALAQALVRLAAWLAPSNERDEWRREWLAELHYRATRGRPLAAFALGAPIHALWLRKEQWRPTLIMSYLRFSLRALRRRPGLASASVLTLALGIGATTAIFSAVYGILLKPLPYRDPSTLVQLWEHNPLFNWTEAEIAPGNLISWRERNHVFADLAWYTASATRQAGVRDITFGGDRPTRVRALPVSGNFFDVLGVQARLGRTFARGEDVPGHHREIVLSDAFWRSHFAADPDIAQRTAVLNGVSFAVIGVMSPSFRFDQADIDFWVPLAMNLDEEREVRRPHFLRAVARLKPGVTVAQAQTDLSQIASALEREHPDTNRQMGVGVGPLDEWFVGQTRRPLLTFLAGVALLLFISCANVASLLLARASERAREMSVRAALGASRAHLVRQLLVESLVLAMVGTLAGVGLAVGALRVFVHLAPAGIPRLEEIGLHPAVAAFAVGLTWVTALLVGLVPALDAARTNLRNGLSLGVRATASRAPQLRRVLVGVEVMLAVVLLVGAMLTLRSFRALVGVDPGFAPAELASARVALPNARYGKDGEPSAFFEQVLAKVRSLPGVTSAGATAALPLEGRSWTGDLFIEGRPEVHGRELRHRSISAGYLETLGPRLIYGRTISSVDTATAPQVVVINDTLARQYFPNQNPVGRRIAFDTPGPKTVWRTIVGVVGDQVQDGPGVPQEPEVYQSHLQEEWSDMAILVRTAAAPASVLAGLRQVIHDRDPQLAVYDVGPFSDHLARALVRQRFSTRLVGLFAGVALLLAAVGIYGVTSQVVAARTREIGVRVAFGATRTDVLRLIVRQELRVVIVGLAAGCGLAALASRALASMLYGVTVSDPASFGSAALVLFVVGLVACFIPARRALRVDPIAALRVE
jgi:putative ABC transport system permease protein